MQLLFRTLFSRLVTSGNLSVQFADGSTHRFGDGTGEPLLIRFNDARAPIALMRNPELVFGELFMDGRMEFVGASVYDALLLISRNSMRRGAPAWIGAIRRVRDAAQAFRLPNFRKAARANVQHHYDLDDRLYRLFLDSDRQYSCAYFERPDATLEEAQLAKKRHIAAKLLLEPGHTVLDIGSGWGGLGLYLARLCGADVLGVTLSDEQIAAANTRAAEAHLSDRVRFALQDYRDVAGPFDRVVSVGMFEHVGPRHYRAYFDAVERLLKPDGVALIHTITRPDGPGTTNPWATKYIFPGGHTPGLSQIVAAVERSGLFITDIEFLRMHYAETLRAWRERFYAHRDEAKALYDERFCRMWDFYLSAAEIAFRFEGEHVCQLQLARRHDAVPVTRGYIAEAEERLRALEMREEALVA